MGDAKVPRPCSWPVGGSSSTSPSGGKRQEEGGTTQGFPRYEPRMVLQKGLVACVMRVSVYRQKGSCSRRRFKKLIGTPSRQCPSCARRL